MRRYEAVVIDASRGEVRLRVARDDGRYPPPGTRVVMKRPHVVDRLAHRVAGRLGRWSEGRRAARP